MSDVPPTPPSPPTAGEPAWLPDPSGRHQLRWWDGTTYTDAVADAGATSTDPLVPPTGPPPAFPATGAGPGLPIDVTGRKASTLPLILAVVGAAVVVVALVTLLGGDGGGGTGEFTGEVTDDEEEGRHEVSVDAGSVLVVEVEPRSDLDAVVEIEVDDDEVQDRLEDLFDGTPLEDPRFDVGFEGDDEIAVVPLPFGVDATVVVTGFEGSEGEYEISIESFDIDVDEEADREDLAEAVDEADDLPRRIRGAAESLLEVFDE